jgi:predicted RNA binding protein YcfA (HicA-like mRNA interferase family)
MARLPSLSSRELIAALRRAGFVELTGRGKGSHHVLHRDDPPTMLPVPERKTLGRGTLRAILRQADITVEELHDLLS